MKIKITKLDIERGIRLNCYNCPIARAIRRCTGKELVGAGYFRIHWGNNGCRTPIEVLDFMNDFDNGLAAKPFEFELEDHESGADK